MHSIHGLVENFVPYIIHNCFWTKQYSLNCIVGYETYWFVKNSSLWPRYWLELLQSFQDQLKDKTPHLLNLARKGFLIFETRHHHFIINQNLLSRLKRYSDLFQNIDPKPRWIQVLVIYEVDWIENWCGYFHPPMICRRLFVRKASQRSFFTKTSEIGSL